MDVRRALRKVYSYGRCWVLEEVEYERMERVWVWVLVCVISAPSTVEVVRQW